MCRRKAARSGSLFEDYLLPREHGARVLHPGAREHRTGAHVHTPAIYCLFGDHMSARIIDFDQLAGPGNDVSVAERQVRRRHNGLFIRGPISYEWFAAASRCPNRALTLAIQLCFMDGCSKGEPIAINLSRQTNLGLDRWAAQRALKALEAAGLVSVERRNGARPVVTLLGSRPANAL
jgi:hypothetical protein